MKILSKCLVICVFAATVACNPSVNNNELISNFSGELNASEIQKGILTPEILWKFGRIGSFEVSPDGKKVIYEVTRYDAKTIQRTSNIYILPLAGGDPINLTENRFKDVAPTWTPDGKIAFLSNRFGDMQLWTMDEAGMERKQITKIDGGIDAFKISPDNSKLLYTKNVKLEQSVTEKHSDLDKANARVMDDLMYRHWNDWSDYKFSHIFVADMSEKLIKSGKDIMENELWDAPLSPYFNDGEITWSPDSKTIAYTCKKLYGRDYAVSTNSDIYLYNIKSGETKNITKANLGYDKYPVFSADGSKIAYMSMKTPGYESDKERLMILDLQSGNLNYLNDNWDQNAHGYCWSKDGKELFFISGKNAKDQIYKVDIATKEFTAITKGQHRYTSFSKANDILVGAKTTHQRATELFVINSDGSETKFTNENKNIYDKIDFGHSEERWVETTDGKQMLVWVIYPPNFDKNKKYPTLLYCQGGPQSTVGQFFSYRWNFAMMGANDYIIVAPNRRGVPSFGQEWNAQISGDYSGQNIKDYLSAIDELAKEPFVDENNLGAVGASYGGYSVFYLAGHHEKRFKAFISHCGIYNWESMYASTEETFFPNHDLGGPYWDTSNKVAQRSYKNSPHKFVDKWDTPIMIIHGEKDFRVPYTQSIEAFNAAQLRGIPSRLLYFPEETHFVVQPQNAILWQREFFEWFDKYLK